MFECEYCEMQFVTEDFYEEHRCDKKEKFENLKTMAGQNAYKLYKKWFKIRCLPEPSSKTYVSSKCYNVFFKIVDFFRTSGIPDSETYIKFMVNENIIPQHWSNQDIYEYFMEKYDTDVSYKTHVMVTLKNLEKIAAMLDCKINEVFDHLRAGDAANLIQTRNISPYVILLSKKFETFFSESLSPDQQTLIEDVINLNKWRIIFRDNEHVLPEIRGILSEIDL